MHEGEIVDFHPELQGRRKGADDVARAPRDDVHSEHPADGPVEWLALLASALVTQNWMLAAADIRLSGAKGNIAKLGLTKIQSDTLRVWLKDDDSGLARTMAALDRKLRDGEALMKRLETPIALCSGLARVFRSLREERTSSKTQAHDRAD